MRHSKGCTVLGRYCWTHKAVTEAGLPGWPRTGSGNEYTHYSPWASNANGGVTKAIIWANGDVHSDRGFSEGARKCILCGLNCNHPVEPTGGYQEIRTGMINKG